MSVLLNILDEKNSVTETIILEGKTTYHIGRGKKNDISLPFSWVSRQHSMVQLESSGAYNAIDLGSANGTFVNGTRIYSLTRLHTGDQLGIGKTTLVFINDEEKTAIETGDFDDLEEQTVAFVNKEIVTVLISDIRDYTHLAETIGDQETTKLLQVWNSKVNDLVKQHDGIVDKFIGDAVMALWLGGKGPKHNVQQALSTALKINTLTNHLHDVLPGVPWQLSTGAAINTGEALVGNIGGSGRRDFTVIGDAVNVVFRLEEMTGQSGYDLLVGNQAASYLENIGNYFTENKFFLKGKEDRVSAYGCSFEKLNQYLCLGPTSWPQK